MGKVMKCDGTATGLAAVGVGPFAGVNDLWVTMDLYIGAAAEAYFESDYCSLIDVYFTTGGIAGGLGTDSVGPGMYIGNDLGNYVRYTSLPVTDAWKTVELHYARNDKYYLWYDGVLQANGPVTPNTGVRQTVLGITSTDPNAAAILYVDNVKVGTTRGGTEIFSEDFEGVTPLANFDNVYDDVSVVDDPFPADVVVVELAEGIVIAFDDTPLTLSPTWTRIDDPAAINVVQRWSIDRGRTSELEKTGTGTATIELMDTTGRFDPTNATSSLFGKLNPMKQVAINLENPVTGDWSCLFRGFISDWDFEYADETEKYLRVTLECVDAFDMFASLEMTPGNAGNTVPTQSSGDIYFDDDSALDAVQTRVNQALDDASWSATLREIFTANVGLQGTVYARNDGLLSVIMDAADAEFPGGVANAFMRKDGYAVLHGRFAKFNPTDPTYDITTWKAGDLAAFGLDSDTAVISKPYQFSRSRDKIINRALSLPQGVDEADVPGQIVSDATSITNYGVRSVSFDNLLTRNGSGPTTAVQETKLFGTYYVDNYKDPRTRVDTLTFRPQPPDSVYGPATWLLMAGVDISDRVHLKTTHTGGGGFNEYFFVEGVHYRAEPMSDEQHEVTLELDLSPAAYFDTNPF